MEIHVYDRNLRRLGHIENHTSLQWHRKYYECGTFELHCPVTAENLRLLQPGNIITKGDNKQEAAVIRGDQAEEESTLVNEITRNGFFLPVYLGDRLTGPQFNFNGTVEAAMHYMIGRMEKIPLLQIGATTGDTTKVQFQATYKNVLEYFTKLAKFAEIGFRIVPDFKKKTMTFETYKGVDRTQAQGENPRVIFSESYDNLNQAKHNYSDATYKTKVIVGGAGDGGFAQFREKPLYSWCDLDFGCSIHHHRCFPGCFSAHAFLCHPQETFCRDLHTLEDKLTAPFIFPFTA